MYNDMTVAAALRPLSYVAGIKSGKVEFGSGA